MFILGRSLSQYYIFQALLGPQNLICQVMPMVLFSMFGFTIDMISGFQGMETMFFQH